MDSISPLVSSLYFQVGGNIKEQLKAASPEAILTLSEEQPLVWQQVVPEDPALWNELIRSKLPVAEAGSSMEMTKRVFQREVAKIQNPPLHEYILTVQRNPVLGTTPILYRDDPVLTHKELVDCLTENFRSTLELKNGLQQVLSEKPPTNLRCEHVHALAVILEELTAFQDAIELPQARPGDPEVFFQALSVVVAAHASTVTLSLCDQGLGDEGLNPLLDLIRSGKVSSLDLSHNNITNKGCQQILEAVNDEKSAVWELKLTNNRLSEEILDFVQNNLVGHNKNIDFTGNSLPLERAKALNTLGGLGTIQV